MVSTKYKLLMYGKYLDIVKTGVGLFYRIVSAVKMFQPMPVHRLTDVETCFKIIYIHVSIDLVVYKGPIKSQLPKTAYMIEILKIEWLTEFNELLNMYIYFIG